MPISVLVRGPYPATMGHDTRLMSGAEINQIVTVPDEVFNDKLKLIRQVFKTPPPANYSEEELRRSIEAAFEFDIINAH